MIGFAVAAVLVLTFLFDIAVSTLNYRQRRKPIPGIVRGIYDPGEYTRWLNYSMEGYRLGMVRKTVNFLILFGLLVFGVFGVFEAWAGALVSHSVLQTLIFIGIYGLLSMLIDIPFDYYSSFIIEERYGFNRTTRKTFLLDILKSILVGTLIFGGLAAALNAVFLQFQDALWTFAAAAWAVVSVVMVVFFVLQTKVFVKVFNKLTPLPEGELKGKIEALAKKAGFKVSAISVMDASRRSTKLNAFFSGLGKTREVVLFDTLVEKMSDDQVLAVLAHELGHAVHKDAPRLLLQQMGIFALYAAVIAVILQSDPLAQAFGLTGVHFGFALVLFFILISPINLLLSVPTNYLSRRAEYRADAFSAEHVDKQQMIGALKVLVKENFANLNPHPLAVWLHYSHPTMADRLGALEKLKSV